MGTRTPLRAHGTATTVAVITILVVSTLGISTAHQKASLTETVTDIGIEHQQPLSLSMEIGTLQNVAVVELLSESEEHIAISIPSHWIKSEVKHVPIKQVKADEPSFGFTRYHLPGFAGISFRVPEAPHTIVVHNPSGVPLKIDLTRVSLPDETVKRDVLLIHDSAMRLW